MRTKPKLIIGGLLAVVALFFVLQNAAVVQIRFLFWSTIMSQAVVILLSLVAGVIIGWVLSSGFRISRK